MHGSEKIQCVSEDVWSAFSSNCSWNSSKCQISCDFVEFHKYNFNNRNRSNGACDYNNEYIFIK